MVCGFCGHRGGSRSRISPTSRAKDWSVLVDKCYNCGTYIPVSEITYAQADWLYRLNSGIQKDYVLKPKVEPPRSGATTTWISEEGFDTGR